jgi:hypothetical protein
MGKDLSDCLPACREVFDETDEMLGFKKLQAIKPNQYEF